MKKFVTGLAMGLFSGIVVGLASGYFVAKRIVSSKMEKEMNDLKEAHEVLMDRVAKAGSETFSENETNARTDGAKDIYHIDRSSLHPSCTISQSLDPYPLKKKEIAHYEKKVADFYGPSDPEETQGIDRHIRILSEDDVPDYDDFEHITLTYYRDGVLADEEYVIMDDAENQIGHNTLSMFQEDGNSVIYVLNAETEIVYEILWSSQSYEEDVVSDRPYLRLPEGEEYI